MSPPVSSGAAVWPAASFQGSRLGFLGFLPQQHGRAVFTLQVTVGSQAGALTFQCLVSSCREMTVCLRLPLTPTLRR